MAQREGETFSFIAGLIVGVFISAPIAAWLSPRSGLETRESIRQQGVIIRKKAAEAVLKPVEQLQETIEHIKGDSVDDAIEEGKALAAQRAAARLSAAE
jgi:gas vesicle protein